MTTGEEAVRVKQVIRQGRDFKIAANGRLVTNGQVNKHVSVTLARR